MYCYNAQIIISQLLDYVGENVETCQPLFNTKDVIIDIYISLYKRTRIESHGLIKTQIIFDGRTKTKIDIDNKEYKGKLLLSDKQELCGTFIFYPSIKPSISTDYYFGFALSGEFISD
jgi:hypothetical protein